MLSNVAAATIFLWSALFAGDQIDTNSIIKGSFAYETMEQCEADGYALQERIKSDQNLVDKLLDEGYEGMLFLCTDDPDPFNTEK